MILFSFKQPGCEHFVLTKEMQELQVTSDCGSSLGACITYKGFCNHCKAYVSLKERVYNRGLYQWLVKERTKNKGAKQ